MIDAVIPRWHRFVSDVEPDALDELLADDAVFYSPVVFTPQRGKDMTKLYLLAAKQILPGDGGRSFRYTREVLAGDTAVLEFETTLDGKYVNGVDIIRCDPSGRIVEFRVMLRPLQGLQAVQERMRAMLEAMRPT